MRERLDLLGVAVAGDLRHEASHSAKDFLATGIANDDVSIKREPSEHLAL